MFVFSSLDFYFRLTKCNLPEKTNKQKQTQTTHQFSFGTFDQLRERTIQFSCNSVYFYIFTEKRYG